MSTSDGTASGYTDADLDTTLDLSDPKSVQSLLEETYVFVARFSDGRKKCRIRFCRGPDENSAREKLPAEWDSDDVYVDELGSFNEFYSLAPRLRYDLKKDQPFPTALKQAVGTDALNDIIEVVSSGAGWDKLPSRETVFGNNTRTVITEQFDEVDPVAAAARSILTDKLLVFRDRLRRIARNDVVDCEQALENGVKRFGLQNDDAAVVRLLQMLTIFQNEVPTGHVGCAGIHLTQAGVPRPGIQCWVEQNGLEDQYFPADYSAHDIVLPIEPSWGQRRIVHQALNAVNWFISRSHEESFDWYVVFTGEEPSLATDWFVTYARNEQHATAMVTFGAEDYPSESYESDTVTCLGTVEAFAERVRDGERWRESDPMAFELDTDPASSHIPDRVELLIQTAAADTPEDEPGLAELDHVGVDTTFTDTQAADE